MTYDDLPTLCVKPRKNQQHVFNTKSIEVQKTIREALFIMKALGIPIEDYTPRKQEKAAMALCAVGCVKKSSDWKKIKDENDGYSITTKEIIEFYNSYFQDRVSVGSYDYVLRDDLKQLLIAEVVKKSKPGANLSNPTRGYCINTEYSKIIKNYGQKDWFEQVKNFNKMRPSYQERLEQDRDIRKIPVTLPDGTTLQLKDGDHNTIQKLVIEEFLGYYGYGAKVLYIADSDKKFGGIFDEKYLKQLGFLDLKQNKLPDIVAYSQEKDWIYMIEAYHTSNPITSERKYELVQLMGEAAHKAIFVTAFENNKGYRSCPEELAWETEVWIATDPKHMIHRNGSRFMGPYNN